jgi:hypothetical protein
VEQDGDEPSLVVAEEPKMDHEMDLPLQQDEVGMEDEEGVDCDYYTQQNDHGVDLDQSSGYAANAPDASHAGDHPQVFEDGP